MAESGIKPKVRNIKSVKHPKNDLWHKIKEITADIAIIVFAVSLSLGFHTLNEQRKERNLTQDFLTGVHLDLKKDIAEMSNSLEKYEEMRKGYQYLAQIPHKQLANLDSLNKYSPYKFSYSNYAGNSGRYEGFKSSGKIGLISDEELQNDILDLYEEKIPILVEDANFYNAQKLKLVEYAINKTKGFPAGNFANVISEEPVKNRCKMFLTRTDVIEGHYRDCLELMEKIVDQIEANYPPKKNH